MKYKIYKQFKYIHRFSFFTGKLNLGCWRGSADHAVSLFLKFSLRSLRGLYPLPPLYTPLRAACGESWGSTDAPCLSLALKVVSPISSLTLHEILCSAYWWCVCRHRLIHFRQNLWRSRYQGLLNRRLYLHIQGSEFEDQFTGEALIAYRRALARYPVRSCLKKGYFCIKGISKKWAYICPVKELA